jgi:hypothetical protein
MSRHALDPARPYDGRDPMLEPLPENPTIGVHALVHNHEDFIASAIESVLAQGWPADRLHFVLLDDGSTDATPERVKPYEKYLTYVRQENQGINAAFSRVVSLTHGDILMTLSGDDEFTTDRFERVVAHFRERPDVGMVYGDMEMIDNRGRVFAPSVMAQSNEQPLRGQIAGRLLKGNFVSAGAMSVRGELKRVLLPMPDAAAWEDWWWAWAATNVAPIDYLDAVVYRYRKHDNNFMLGVVARNVEFALDRLVDEIPFRRYMLGAVRPGTCTPHQLLEAADEFRRLTSILTSRGRPQAPFAEVTDAHRAAAERLTAEAAALASTVPQLAAFAAARALAADPGSDEAYRVLHAVAGSPRTTAPPSLEDVRAVTVFAEAEDLARHPSLLQAYVDAFGPDDDVTLVMVAHEWDGERLGAQLGPLVEQVAGDAAPDMLALPAGAAPWVTAMTQADCVLGLDDLPIPGVPRFAEAGALREYVQLRWRFPRRRS